MSLVNLVKKLFKRKDKNEKTLLNDNPETGLRFEVEIVDVAPNIYLACRGAKACVNKEMGNGTLTDRLHYLSKVVGKGHESVIEHSNIIAVIKIFKSSPINGKDLAELMGTCKFTNVSVQETNDMIYILIGGSIRAFKHIILYCSADNIYIPTIREIIYQSIEKEFLQSLIDKSLLDEYRCTYFPNGEVVTKGDEEDCEYIYDPIEIEGKWADLVYSTNYNEIYKKIRQYGFNKTDAFKVSVVTFFFHDISRSCANQLTRHRNGISQESQRYVTHDYQINKDFVDPIKMNWEEKYKNKLDKTSLKKIQEIDMFKTYKYLISAAVLKEDARAWLPMNVTTKLLVTFSYFNFAKFLDLRLDKAAQLEIRRTAAEAASQVFGRKIDKKDPPTQFFIYDALNTVNAHLFATTVERRRPEEDKVDEEIGSVELGVEDIKPVNADEMKKFIQ